MTTLALIGLGAWGKNYLATAQTMDNCRIKYVCTTHPRGDKTKEIVHVFDYKKLLQYPDIDGIVIATPASTHFQIAKFFLEKDKNLLIEKPLATRYEDALTLVDAGRKHKGIVMVGHVYLSHPAFHALLPLLGRIGDVIYVDSTGGNFGPMRDDVSALWDWGPHDVSMILAVLGRLPTSVSAWAVRSKISGRLTQDMVYAHLDFAGTSAFLRVGWLSPVRSRRLTIVGEKGSIIFDDTARSKVAFFSGKGLRKVSHPFSRSDRPLAVQLSDFVRCIQKDQKPVSDLAFGVSVVSVIDAMERSLQRGGGKVAVKRV